MKNGKKFFDKFNHLNGASFIAINGYCNSANEIANHVVNANCSTENAKVKDNTILHSLVAENIAKDGNFSLEITKLALSEMIIASDKNIGEYENRTNQSKGQDNAYVYIGKSIRMHIETEIVHIFAQKISKVVLIKGEYKSVKSSDKTLCKNYIKKTYLTKYSDFKLGNIDSIKISGEVIELA